MCFSEAGIYIYLLCKMNEFVQYFIHSTIIFVSFLDVFRLLFFNYRPNLGEFVERSHRKCSQTRLNEKVHRYHNKYFI